MDQPNYQCFLYFMVTPAKKHHEAGDQNHQEQYTGIDLRYPELFGDTQI